MSLWQLMLLHKKYFGQMLLGFALAFITLLSGIGLLSLSGWFITATALAGLSRVTAQSFNFFSAGAGVRGFSMLRTAGRYFEKLVTHNATFYLLSSIRQWFFDKLTYKSYLELSQFRQGDLLNRFMSDIEALDRFYLGFLVPVGSFVVLLLCLACLAFFFNFAFFSVILLSLIVFLLMVPPLFYFLGKKSGYQLLISIKNLRQHVLDYVNGLADFLIYDHWEKMINTINDSSEFLIEQQATMAKLEASGKALVIFIIGIMVLLTLWYAIGVYEGGHFSAPTMIGVWFAVMALIEAIAPMSNAFQFLGYIRCAIDRLTEMTQHEKKSVSQSVQLSNQNTVEAIPTGSIFLKNLTFSYHSIFKPIINSINLTIQSGERIALMGPTGAGKSTIVKLISGQLKATPNSIFLGGQSIENYKETTLATDITLVSQHIYIMSSSLRDNLLIANQHATDEELLDIINQVGLNRLGNHSFKDLKLLLDQPLVGNGIQLSGGEQKRLAIARAFIKSKPKILIVDEPFEGLDEQSAHQLCKLLFDHFDGVTIIAILHSSKFSQYFERVHIMVME